MSQQLKDKYAVPVKVAQYWIERNQLLPLLDGLDELRRVDDSEAESSEELDRQRQAKQIQCMRAINTFLDMHSDTSAVVCCRRREYESLEQQGEYLKRLKGAIYLQALDDEQIRDYFVASNREALWDALKNQPELLELARSPLFLLMLVVAYREQPIQNSDELLDLYIEKQLADLNNRGAYPPGKAPSAEQTHHYLCWLATKLEEREITEFLIERLQQSWLDRERDRSFYRLTSGLTFGLIFGLVNGLSEGWIIGLNSGMLFGLGYGLIAWFIMWIITWIRDIRIAETLSFSLRNLILGLLICGLVSGVYFGLFSMLIYGPNIGLNSGLVFGLTFGLLFGLGFGLRAFEVSIDDKQISNQGIKKSLKTSLVVWLIAGSVFALLYGLINGLTGGVINGLFGGLASGLGIGLFFMAINGLGAVIQHYALRFTLHQAGVAPWNYEKFLTHAENHRFIQRVGGRYRFVHDLLRKRFAQRYQP